MTVLTTRKLKTLSRRAYNKYSYILDLYHTTRTYWEEQKSRKGGYHIAQLAPDGLTRTGADANLRIRQYPLVAPSFSRTYIAMLPPTHLGASGLDYRLYDGNRLSVIPGRIALYYAPTGGYHSYPSRQADGMELLTWHPSGECIINQNALRCYNLGSLTRVERFADITVFGYRLARWIQANSKPLGKLVPCSCADRGAYRKYDHTKHEYTEPVEYFRWERNFNSSWLWSAARPDSALLIPSDRRKGLFAIRVTRAGARDSTIQPSKLTSYTQWVAARKHSCVIRRKLRSAVNSVRRDPQMVAHLATLLNRVLDAREMDRVLTNFDGTVSDLTDYDQIETVKEVETTVQSWSEASKVGDRHARFLQLDEYNDE